MAHAVVRRNRSGKLVEVIVFRSFDSKSRGQSHAERLTALTGEVFWVENRPDLDYA